VIHQAKIGFIFFYPQIKEQMAWSLSISAIPAAPSRLLCPKSKGQSRAPTIGASGLKIRVDFFIFQSNIYKLYYLE